MIPGEAGAVGANKGSGIQVGMSMLTFEQLQQLPTGPAALKAWLTRSLAGDPTTHLPERVPLWLGYLLWKVPAPPAVRAAAFRALASMPNVTNLGPADGGQALRVSYTPPAADKSPDGTVPAGPVEITLVIDPATSMLLSQTSSGGTELNKILTAEWTNDMPSVIPPPHK